MISKVSTIAVTFACLLALTSCATTPTPSPTLAPAHPSESTEWIEKVVRAWVVAHPHNWDADAKDDGLRVWVELQDINEDEVRYRNINVPVEIIIYSTESKTYPWKSARVIYSGYGLLTHWDDDAFVTGAKGIKDISWEEIASTLPGEIEDLGILYIILSLGNGKEYSAEYYPVRIKAE